MVTLPEEATYDQKKKGCYITCLLFAAVIVFFIIAQFSYPGKAANTFKDACYADCVIEKKYYLESCQMNCDEEAEKVRESKQFLNVLKGLFFSSD